MRIGFNARFLTQPFTGIGQYTRHLISAMAKVAPENEYFLFTPELVTDFEVPENVQQIRVAEKDFDSESIKKAHWEQVLLPQEMSKFNLNIIHYLYPSNPLKSLSVPVVVTVHDVIPWRLKEYRQRIRSKVYHMAAKQALKKARHIITVSEFSKKELEEVLKFDSSSIKVTPLAPPSIDPGLMPPDLPLRRNYFLYVGGFDERKNIPALIQAYQKHIAPNYSIDLILVGGKNRGFEVLLSKEHCEKVADKYRLEPKGKVIFTKPLESHELMGLYHQALALVHPSTYEGFNLPLVEAMSAGIPIIASDIEVHREVTDGNALFMDPYSIDSIGLAMHQLVNDSNLQANLADQSKMRAQDFSWQKTAEETLWVYDLYT